MEKMTVEKLEYGEMHLPFVNMKMLLKETKR